MRDLLETQKQNAKAFAKLKVREQPSRRVPLLIARVADRARWTRRSTRLFSPLPAHAHRHGMLKAALRRQVRATWMRPTLLRRRSSRATLRTSSNSTLARLRHLLSRRGSRPLVPASLSELRPPMLQRAPVVRVANCTRLAVKPSSPTRPRALAGRKASLLAHHLLLARQHLRLQGQYPLLAVPATLSSSQLKAKCLTPSLVGANAT